MIWHMSERVQKKNERHVPPNYRLGGSKLKAAADQTEHGLENGKRGLSVAAGLFNRT